MSDQQQDRDTPAAFLAPIFAKLQIRQSEAPRVQPSNQDDYLRDPVVEHGRLACLQLCEKMHATLPRELRDMIYSNILGPYHYELVTKRGSHTWNNGVIRGKGIAFVNTELRKMSETEAKTIHWWLNCYMGEEIAIEIIERWYRTRTFQFTSLKLYMLPVFLATDPFDKGFEPGLLIQRIRIHIDALGSTERFTAVEHHLHAIKNKHVDLSIRIDNTDGGLINPAISIMSLVAVLGAVAVTVYQLRKDGFDRVTVKKSHPLTDYTFLFDVEPSVFSDNLKQWQSAKISKAG